MVGVWKASSASFFFRVFYVLAHGVRRGGGDVCACVERCTAAALERRVLHGRLNCTRADAIV